MEEYSDILRRCRADAVWAVCADGRCADVMIEEMVCVHMIEDCGLVVDGEKR
jgi:hypothetical protein